MIIHNGMPARELKEAVLFAFDDHSVPFRNGLELHLINSKPLPFQDNPVVLDNGPAGAHDCHQVHYRGTTLRLGDELRMYYWGSDGKNGSFLCIATSGDGIHWERPQLGLVEYNGSKSNNIVDVPASPVGTVNLVLQEPEEPDGSKRFKMMLAGQTFYSPDGLRWRGAPNGEESLPKKIGLEHGGLMKLNDLYYLNGQIGTVRRHARSRARRMLVMISPDLEHWLDVCALGADRSNIDFGPAHEDRMHHQKEIHLGASMHDRGSVILGIFGMMDGAAWADFHRAQIDLGLMISHDAIHFREPLPGFRFIPVGNTLSHDTLIGLSQGQGMHHVGEKTMYWYASTHDGRVRVATWGRDRFGYLSPFTPTSGTLDFVTCAISLDAPAELRVNVDMAKPPPQRHVSGHDAYREMRFEILGGDLWPIDGYRAADCVPIADSGFEIPVLWKNRARLPNDKGPIRIRGMFDGNRPEDIRFHALYVSGGS